MTSPRNVLRRSLALLLYAAGLGIAPAAPAAEPNVMAIGLVELRELGIAIDTSRIDVATRLPVPRGVAEPFPNRCYGALSVSDELLERMEAQGFSLQTLCLGLRSDHVAFHPETGAALAQVRVPTLKDENGKPDEWQGVVTLLIDIPRCFANGTPYLDCRIRYEKTNGARAEPGSDAAGQGEQGKKIDRAVQALLAKGAFQRECGCADLRVRDFNEDAHYRQDVWRRPGAACRVGVMPECPKLRARFSLPGSLLIEFTPGMLIDEDSRLAKQFGLPAAGLSGALNEDFEIDPELPRGYAYSYITPEGDNERPVKPPPKGRKLSVGSR